MTDQYEVKNDYSMFSAVLRAISTEEDKLPKPWLNRDGHGATTDEIRYEIDTYRGHIAQFRLAKLFISGASVWHVSRQMFIPAYSGDIENGDVIVDSGEAFVYHGRVRGWACVTDTEKLLRETVKDYPYHDQE